MCVGCIARSEDNLPEPVLSLHVGLRDHTKVVGLGSRRLCCRNRLTTPPYFPPFFSQCYYLGATTDAATKILGEVTRPMSVHMPTVKICEKLKKMDSQICELKYGTRDTTVFPNVFHAFSSLETLGHVIKASIGGRESLLTDRLLGWCFPVS